MLGFSQGANFASMLAARAERRAKSSAAARKEIAEFTAEFLSAAREVFELMDEDDSGTLTKEEITTAVKANKEVIDFLVNCGNPNLQYLLVPARLEAALEALDTDRSGEIDAMEWEAAIETALKAKLEQRRVEREQAQSANRAEIEAFTAEFMAAAQSVFEMIDKDDSGTLEKQEVIDAVSADKKVINFLVNCGEPNLQYLLVPARLESALQQLDTDRDGHIDAQEWEDAIEDALSNKLAQRALKREADAAAARSWLRRAAAVC